MASNSKNSAKKVKRKHNNGNQNIMRIITGKKDSDESSTNVTNIESTSVTNVEALSEYYHDDV